MRAEGRGFGQRVDEAANPRGGGARTGKRHPPCSALCLKPAATQPQAPSHYAEHGTLDRRPPRCLPTRTKTDWLHHRRGTVARYRDRGEYGDLQSRRRRAPASDAGAPSGEDRGAVPETASVPAVPLLVS